jgi:membrane fusion protein, multidrug efflux system
MNSNRICALLAAFLVPALFLLSGCNDNSQGPPPSAPKAVEVDVMSVRNQELRQSVELPGRTTAFRVAEVRPQVSGIVHKRLFAEGSRVEAGELLYQIDPATYESTLASAEAALAKSEAMEYSTRLKALRYNNLIKTDAVSEQEQIDAEAVWKQAVAEVAAARAAVQSAAINLAYTRVTAPIGGQIGKSMISEGALVTAQQATALATIQQLDPLFVDVSQSAGEYLQLKKDLAAGTGTGSASGTEVKIILSDGAEYEETGMLEFSDVTVDQSTGTVTIRAIIANPKQELLPGMFVRARLTSAQLQPAILIPQSAIVRNNRGQAMVMLVDTESKVEARLVETGRNIGEQIVIREGLAAGDQLIVAGLQKIRPGAPVKAVVPGPETETQDDSPEHLAEEVN